MNEATGTAAMEAFERALLGGSTVQEYYGMVLLVSVMSIAIIVIFFIVLYMNRAVLKRWLRNLLN